MYYGLPVIASHWGGYKDTINHGINGFLVDTLWGNSIDYIDKSSILSSQAKELLIIGQSVVIDYSQMMNYIKILVENPNLRFKLGQNAKLRSLQYTWNHIIPKYINLWDELIKNVDINKKVINIPQLYINRFEVFKHYSKDILSRDTKVYTNYTTNINILSNIKKEIYNDIINVLDLNILNNILNISKECKTIQEIINKSNADEYKIIYHILWLLKHKYLYKLQ